MVFMSPPADIQLAEEVNEWPRACAVCFHEHGGLDGGLVELAQTREEAIEHRRTAHPWLHAWLDAHGLAGAL